MRILTLGVLALGAGACWAGDVSIVEVRFQHQGGDTWRVSTTLRHADTGWDHYADGWRVESPEGAVLGTRTLYHPHVDEQPFERSLGGVRVPADMPVVVVKAHDSAHGWSPDVVRVDLREGRGERFEVQRRD